jgi:hypothetical protein
VCIKSTEAAERVRALGAAIIAKQAGAPKKKPS